MKKIINWLKEMANKILTLLGLKKKVYAAKNSVSESTVTDTQAGTVDVTITDGNGDTVSKDDNQCVTKGDADRGVSDGVTITGPDGYEDNQLIPDATVTKKEEEISELGVSIKWYPSSNDNLKSLFDASYAEMKAQSAIPIFGGHFSCYGYVDITTTPNIHTTTDPYSIMISTAFMERISMKTTGYKLNVTLPDDMLNTSLELTGRKFNCTVEIEWQTGNFASSNVFPKISYVLQKDGSTVNNVTINGKKYTYTTPTIVNFLDLTI